MLIKAIPILHSYLSELKIIDMHILHQRVSPSTVHRVYTESSRHHYFRFLFYRLTFLEPLWVRPGQPEVCGLLEQNFLIDLMPLRVPTSV